MWKQCGESYNGHLNPHWGENAQGQDYKEKQIYAFPNIVDFLEYLNNL